VKKTVNGVANFVLVEMGRDGKLCTFFKNLLHCEMPTLSEE
jgi:hypothetical protein